jgi:hypothetical protein
MRVHLGLATLSLVVALAGCTSVPINNVSDAAVTTASGKQLSAEQVRAAILRAGAALGWQIKDESPTLLVASIQLRSHQAVVEIPYSASSYSIKYRSSVNLDERAGNIHKNYNGWIQNLTRGINAQLSAS